MNRRSLLQSLTLLFLPKSEALPITPKYSTLLKGESITRLEPAMLTLESVDFESIIRKVIKNSYFEKDGEKIYFNTAEEKGVLWEEDWELL